MVVIQIETCSLCCSFWVVLLQQIETVGNQILEVPLPVTLPGHRRNLPPSDRIEEISNLSFSSLPPLPYCFRLPPDSDPEDELMQAPMSYKSSKNSFYYGIETPKAVSIRLQSFGLTAISSSSYLGYLGLSNTG